ncbi:DUF1848 domain-containing protein [Aeromonas veronii]|uniref:DUF1848 domain-containing protein n=2 Tax=Aeromonas TaxID=642 RepID=UPI001115AF15|nr:DUF1848 domain-containing protein [Aeromonas veronii]TNI50215.1 hypothetical protein CF127_05415 [Aeromonas veronii]
MIISASRRTDIPAFYTPWFMNRVRAGFLLTRNPFNAHQIKRVSLHPNEVDAIVFWTRNPLMLMMHLDELDNIGHKYYFQYTITGYPSILENNVPKPHRAIKTFCELSDKIGYKKVIWRYDPILLSNLVDINEHKRLFYKIASMLAGKTEKVVISFSDMYKKTERNLNAIEGLAYNDILNHKGALYELSEFMSHTASCFGMKIETCAEDIDISNFNIPHGKCIDDILIRNISNKNIDAKKDSTQREACGCIKSIDIGAYNTCLHGCSYCYATYNQNAVIRNKQQHDPNSPFLIGGIDGVNEMYLLDEPVQRSLF